MKFVTRLWVTRIVCSFVIMASFMVFAQQVLHPQVFAKFTGTEQSEDTWRNYIENKIDTLRKSLELVWCKTQKVQSNGGFCITEEQLIVGGNQLFDPMLCSVVESLAVNGSVADLGAGLGLYGMCLLRAKSAPFVVSRKYNRQLTDHYMTAMGEKYNTQQVISSYNGFDGAGNIEELSGGFIQQADLSVKNLWLGRQWDWVMSVEVGEHIAASHENDFLDNLVRHACKGVLLTWAVEGQGGHAHINERNNDYIRARMLERGLVNDIEDDYRLRKDLIINYIKNTLMLFRFPRNKTCNYGNAKL